MPTFKVQEVRRIVNVIYKAIIEQRLPAGTRLIEIKLSEALKANRNHVRSALQELQSRGVVIIETNKGACVCSPSRDEAREVFEARRIIEAALIRKAVEQAGTRDFQLLEKLIEQENAAIARASRPDMVRLSGEFHLAIARVAGNSVLVDALERLVAASSLIIGLYEKTSDQACSSNDHQQLLDLMTTGDKDKAAGFMDEHLCTVESQLLEPEEDAKELDFAELLAS